MKNAKYLLLLVALFSFAACTSNEVVTEEPVAEDIQEINVEYRDLSVCGDFSPTEGIDGATTYSVCRSLKNGDCFLQSIENVDDPADEDCNYDAEEYPFGHPQCDQLKNIKVYNNDGSLVNEIENSENLLLGESYNCSTISQESFKTIVK